MRTSSQRIGSIEFIERLSLRPVAYSAIADLVTQSRADLTVPQAHLVINFFAKLLNNPTSTLNVSTLASKMIFSMAELVLTKDTPDGGCAAINFMLQVCSDKLAALVLMAEEVNERLERQKQEDSTPDVTFIEKDRPVATAPYLTDNPEDVMKGMSSPSSTMSYSLIFSKKYASFSEVYFMDSVSVFRHSRNAMRPHRMAKS